MQHDPADMSCVAACWKVWQWCSMPQLIFPVLQTATTEDVAEVQNAACWKVSQWCSMTQLIFSVLKPAAAEGVVAVQHDPADIFCVEACCSGRCRGGAA